MNRSLTAKVTLFGTNRNRRADIPAKGKTKRNQETKNRKNLCRSRRGGNSHNHKITVRQKNSVDILAPVALCAEMSQNALNSQNEATGGESAKKSAQGKHQHGEDDKQNVIHHISIF